MSIDVRPLQRSSKRCSTDASNPVTLTRSRSSEAVHLVRREWDEAATRQALQAVTERLTRLASCLASSTYLVHGKVPADAMVEARAAAWLRQHLATPLRIAQKPGLR